MLLFEIPKEFLNGVASGKIIRYGTILKLADTGRIIGHVKEAGLLPTLLANPPATFLKVGVQVGSDLVKHWQLIKIDRKLNIAVENLNQIVSTLKSMKLVTSAGALASVATLGVCAVGFLSVHSKLNHLSAGLDNILRESREIRKLVNELNLKIDSLAAARLQTASEQLQIGLESTVESRRNDILQRSVASFHELRKYYLIIFNKYGFWLDKDIPLEATLEMYSRIIVCCLGQLQAEFLLNDIGAYKATLKMITNEIHSISFFDKKASYNSKVNYLGDSNILIPFKTISDEIKYCAAVAIETFERIDSMYYEADYIERKNILPSRYVQELREHNSGLVFLSNA